MKHLLAYGNSDQANFRDPQSREAFDYMTVPGTIASYFEDATAAFVLSSDLQYLIDPRTPLFQANIGKPRASHLTLAAWMSQTLVEAIAGDEDVTVSPELYTGDMLEEIAENLIRRQRGYGDAADGARAKMARYRRLLGEAVGQDVGPVAEGQRPSFILTPYFVTDGPGDPWIDVNREVLRACARLEDAQEISAVVAVMNVDQLGEAIRNIPEGLSQAAFFWVSGFDEREVRDVELRQLGEVVQAHGDRRELINLYGGFFSICLGRLGLWGMNNGLGYSESRSWPQLPATGAAPARYYIPRLHGYYSPRLAQLVMDMGGPDWWCACVVCEDRIAGDMISIVDLPYHDVKKHFALTRRWELELADELGVEGLAEHLRRQEEGFRRDVAPSLPAHLRPDLSHLVRWAAALEGLGGE